MYKSIQYSSIHDSLSSFFFFLIDLNIFFIRVSVHYGSCKSEYNPHGWLISADLATLADLALVHNLTAHDFRGHHIILMYVMF